MPSHGRTTAWLSVCLALTGSMVFAQESPRGGPLILVSPGHSTIAAAAESCTAFSWAPRAGAAGYELAVFTVVGGQLATVPRLHVAVPGRAAAWTPAATDCFPAGTYKWFMREVGSPSQPIGPWSAGLLFSIPDANGHSEPAAESASLSASNDLASVNSAGRTMASPAAGGGKPEEPGAHANPLDEIRASLAALTEKVDELLNPFSSEFCLEAGADLEAGLEAEIKLRGEAEGRVGAEGFGNGVMAKLRAGPEVALAGEFKGAGGAKFGWCWDLGGGSDAATGADARGLRVAALAGGEPLSNDDLMAKALAISDALQLNQERLGSLADLLPNLSTNVDPWSAARSNGPLTAMADVVPLPEGLRARLRNPAEIIATFRAQMELCGQSDLPPAIAALVGEFCGLAANERFGRLLDRVDTTVGTVRTTVTSVKTVVDDIVGRLPVVGDCKLFCG